MAHAEDCSSVLEQFVHDAANLPAEINHLMEEIQAKDALMAESRTIINSRDSSLQKFIRVNGSLAPNAKEEAYNKAITENLDKSLALQDEKIKLADRASALLDRQIKRLDIRLRDLTRAGLLPNDPALPSLLTPNANQANTISSADGASGIKPSAGAITSDLAAAVTSPNAPITAFTPGQRLIITQNGSPAIMGGGLQAAARASVASAHSTGAPGSNAIQYQRQRGTPASGGPDSKRRRFSGYPSGAATALSAANELAASTPRSRTPVAATSGLAPGTQGLKSTSSIMKKAGTGGASAGNKRVAPHHHQQMKKTKMARNSLKGHKHSSSFGSNRGLKATSASAAAARQRSPAVGMNAAQLQSDEEDSVLSSPEGSDVEGLRGTLLASSSIVDDDADLMEGDQESLEEHADGEDTRVYCTCQTVSHGDMVACDNEDCPYEWFHWKCVGLTREPPGTWYCEECRKRLGK